MVICHYFFGLVAKNSKEHLRLFFEAADNEDLIFPCIVGKLEGEEVQFDFDPLSAGEVSQLIHYLQFSLKQLEERSVSNHIK